MAVPIGALVAAKTFGPKVLILAGPIVGREATKAAKTFIPKAFSLAGPIAGEEATKTVTNVASNKKCKRRAHDMAYERNGRYGRVTFSDGIQRWVVAGSDGEVCASFPALNDSTPGRLREHLVGVDLVKCLRVPEKQVKEEQQASKTT